MRYCVLLLTLILQLPIVAQTFTGKVIGEKGDPVPGATIVALDKSRHVITYSIANAEGFYKLDIPEGKAAETIDVNYVGCQKRTLPRTSFKDGMIITLKEGSFLLKEVKVKAQRIQSTGDTLTYSVAGFKQAQDRSIADVIAKMPGLEVKADGKIEYQGKAINKFYIEGADLMGTQYGMANQNISADKVQSVQVLENHQPVKSLRSVTFSDQAALNLVLKDDAKAVWTGSGDIGLGYGKDILYDCRLMGMQFDKKRQALMMYKNNNTGKQLGDEVLDLADVLKGRTDAEAGLLSMVSQEAPNVDESRYTFNHSHLVAGNWLWKTGQDTELRLQGNGFIDQADMLSHTSSTYLTLADMPIIVEDEDVNNTRSEWKAEVNYQYNGSKSFIQNNLKGYLDFNKSKGRMTCDGQNTTMMVKPHKRSLTENFQLSHTTAKNNVYHVESYWACHYLPGQLLTIDKQTERLNLSFLSTQNALLYKLEMGRHYLNNEMGVNYDRQAIGVAMGEEAEQENAYQLLRAYWTPSMSFAFGKHQLEVKARMSYAHQTYRHSRSNHLWLDPSIHWNWKASALSSFSADVGYENTPLTGKSIYDTPIFTTYRTQKVNRGKTDVTHDLRATATYKYANPVWGLFFNVNPMYTWTSGNILYENTLNDRIYTLVATDKKRATKTAGLSGHISKTFGWAKTLLGLGASCTTTDYCMLVTGKVNDARMTVTSVALNFSLRPARFLSVEGSSSVNFNQQKNLTTPLLSSGNTNDWEHRLNIHVFPASGWMLTAKNQLFHTNSEGVGASYFLDLAMSYKSKRWELALSANNIIGTSKLEQHVLGNTIETYMATRLRPREFLVDWAIDL